MLATSFEPVPNTLCLDVLTNLLAWEPLSQAAAYAAASAILDGQWTDAQTAALLTGIQMRGPAIDELAGFVAAVRERSIKVNVNHPDVIDTCGTGGSGLNSINVSTATAIVAAAAGCCVAKHGNRSVSSRAGSTDVLLALGVPMDSEPQSAAERLDTTGIAFLHAPNFHPGLRRVADVRRSLGFRTIFNLVGPLANPAGVRRQLIGAYCGVMLCDIVETLRRLGSKHILAVHGQDGADEITLTAPTMVCELRNGVIHEYIIEPEQFDISRCKPSDIRGGDALANAEAIERALKNQASPVRDFILLNAGAAIYVGGITTSIDEGVSLARETLRSGLATEKLNELRYSPIAGHARRFRY